MLSHEPPFGRLRWVSRWPERSVDEGGTKAPSILETFKVSVRNQRHILTNAQRKQFAQRKMRCFPIFPSVCHRQRGEEGGANASRHSRLMYIHTNRDGRNRWSRTFMHAEAGCVFSPPRSRSCPSRGGHTPPLCCYTSYFVILLVSFVTLC